MFRLVATVRRGSASSLAPTWRPYPTLEEARTAGSALLREERVQRVMIVRGEPLGAFVEWLQR
jgi:hypothetical protein